MNTKQHWEHVYETKARDAVSWYTPHLNTSLQWIQKLSPQPESQAIIDIGAGESTLVDDLLENGFSKLSILDISSKAIKDTQERLGTRANAVTWLTADLLEAELPDAQYDIWHDRAVFHFLTKPEQRERYVQQVRSTLKVGGHLILAVFGPDGPLKCSGLEVCRHDAESILQTFGSDFHLVTEQTEIHHTPFQTTQQFQYVLMTYQPK